MFRAKRKANHAKQHAVCSHSQVALLVGWGPGGVGNLKIKHISPWSYPDVAVAGAAAAGAAAPAASAAASATAYAVCISKRIMQKMQCDNDN